MCVGKGRISKHARVAVIARIRCYRRALGDGDQSGREEEDGDGGGGRRRRRKEEEGRRKEEGGGKVCQIAVDVSRSL